MKRITVALLFSLTLSSFGYAQYGPDGQVLPGDSYHICFATSFQTRLTTDRSVPPSGFDFGGIEAGSWLCTLAAATTGTLLPEWDGVEITWRAVLSDSTANAVDHTNIQGRIYNTAGELLAVDSIDFFDGILFAPIGFDEFGNPIPVSQFWCWTGVTTGGGVSAATCGNWDLTGVDTFTSSATAVSTNWLQGKSLQCVNDSARLIAMSPPIQAPGPGDVNCDGFINLLDISPFVSLLSDGTYDAKADMNFDGNLNLLDIGPFIEALAAK